MTNYRDHITSDHQIMLGKPVIKGTRITVELILRKLAEGATPQNITALYPHVTAEDVSAVLLYAAEVLSNEEFIEYAA